MFLNTTLFKRELKESYNGFGVEVIRFEDGVLHVKGLTWVIEIDEKEADNKFLAALIEVLGPLPEPGTAFKYSTDQMGRIQTFKYIEMYKMLKEAADEQSNV